MIGWWLAVLGVAGAGESEAESTHDRFTSMKDLRVQTELVRPLEQRVVLEQGPERLELEGGWLVPVFSGKPAGEWERNLKRWAASQDKGEVPRLPTPEERAGQELVGFVWTGGTGSLQLALPDRADALILANRMVKDLGADKAKLSAFAHERAPLPVGVTDAVILGLESSLDEVFMGPDQTDPYEVIVVGASKEAERAARHAQELFTSRSQVWREVEQDPGERIAWERIAVERQVRGPQDAYRFWDLSTSERYGLVAPQVGGEADRWLAIIGDPTGQADARRQIRVASLGLPPGGGAIDGLVGGIPHPPSVPGDPSSAPLARIRVDPVLAESTVALTPDPSGVLQVRVDSQLTLRAVGAPIPWIDLELPKVDRVAGSFEILLAELPDGTPLMGRSAEDRRVASADKPKPKPLPPAPRPPGPKPAPDPEPAPPAELPPPAEPGSALVRLQLPAPLKPGEQITVHLVHQDTWPLQNQAELWTGTVSLGVGSGLRFFLPTVGAHPLGSPWPLKATVAVPEKGKLIATLSGRTLREWNQDGWHLTQVDSEAHPAWFPSISVGAYKTVDDPSQKGFPAVRVRMLSEHYGTIEQFAPEVRRVISFYQGWLPEFPVREVEVFESPQRPMGFAWIAPHGMVSVQQMVIPGRVGGNPRASQPHLESAVFAHELAHQYFGHLAPPASLEDFWISESFSELFSCMYVAAAFEPKACRVRQDSNRKEWEASDRPTIHPSLTRAYYDGARGPVVYDYGPYLLGEMLQRRIGLQAFFGGVDLMLREHAYEPLTTECLLLYLEDTSGQELGDFFDFWVHGGFVPEVELAWASKGRTLTGTLTADIPFGTFDVPVRVETREGPVEALVTVTDGQGALELELPSPKVTRVQVDPDGMIVATRRHSRPTR